MKVIRLVGMEDRAKEFRQKLVAQGFRPGALSLDEVRLGGAGVAGSFVVEVEPDTDAFATLRESLREFNLSISWADITEIFRFESEDDVTLKALKTEWMRQGFSVVATLKDGFIGGLIKGEKTRANQVAKRFKAVKKVAL